LTNSRISIGKTGEIQAEEFLLKNDYKIIKKNFRNRFGEIDIIAERNNSLFFIEVKKRNQFSEEFHPLKSMNQKKQKRMIQSAERFIVENSEFASHDAEFCLIVIYPKQEVEFYSSLDFNFYQANPRQSRLIQ
jgi:putative endonuclease